MTKRLKSKPYINTFTILKQYNIDMQDNSIRKDIRTNRICSLMLTHACNLHCVYCFEKFKSNKQMRFDTAKAILEKEFTDYRKIMASDKRMNVDFMGGEPLLNFELIKSIYEWTHTLDLPFEVIFSVTTNGTMLDDYKKDWFSSRANQFRLVMSVDGSEFCQTTNRGVSINTLPLEFIRNTWPNSYFKQTLTHDTLPYYADGVISLIERGFRVATSLAQGHTWEDGDDDVYRKQLQRMGQYYIEHQEILPQTPFDNLYGQLLDENLIHPPQKICGCGTTIHFYDVDGKVYPCHLFLPMVHGKKNVLDDISKIDFNDNIKFISDQCRRCPIVRVCNTCYGFNYINRGDVAKRDMSMCRLYLVEAQEVSAFQIQYVTSLKRRVTEYELLLLQSAMRCYKLVKDKHL